MLKTFILRNDLEFKTILHHEEEQIVIIDHLQLAQDSLVFPVQLSGFLQLVLLGNTVSTIKEKLALNFDLPISEDEIFNLFELMDRFYLLENDTFKKRFEEVTASLRSGGTRKATGSNIVELTSLKNLHEQARDLSPAADMPQTPLKGMILPHIDYQRGFEVYKRSLAWLRHAEKDIELLIILGTDHYSGDPYPILTKLDYQTPNGDYTIAQDLVDSLNHSVPDADLLEFEYRHQFEHSLEIGLNVLSSEITPASVKVLPILAGSVSSIAEISDDSLQINTDLEAFGAKLKEICSQHSTLIIAAADLCHVGPAFGGQALDTAEKAKIKDFDTELLDTISQTDSQLFVNKVYQDKNFRNICGTSSIYYLLNILADSVVYQLDYNQCPADANDTSIVSIAALAFHAN